MPNWKKVIVSGSNAELNIVQANEFSGSFSGSFQGDGSQLTGITGGGGISFNGSTANGLVTYGSATTADVESKLTFDASTLLVSSVNIDSTGVKIYGGVAFTAPPYITPEGNHSVLNFGDVTSGLTLQMLNNKLSFDNDTTNTFIQADTETPENLEIHADGLVQISSNTDITGSLFITSDIHLGPSGGKLYDGAASTGSIGQVLTSTGTGSKWEDATGGSGVSNELAIAYAIALG